MPVRPLCPELAEKARLELGEDPKKLEDGIQHLKEWIAKQPHLRARTDDQWLAAFIRGSKFSIERTKEKIDLYYSMRSIAPELNIIKPSDPKFMEILKSGDFLVLPKTLKPTDPRVFIMRSKYDPKKYLLTEIMSIPHYLQQIMFMEDDTFVVAGAVYISDMAEASMAQFTSITPLQMKKMATASQDASPVRMKAAHYLNISTGFETLFNVAKSFMNEKNKKRLHVYSNKGLEALYANVAKEILPAEYGGNGGTIQEITDYWVKKVEEYSAWLEEDEQFGTDESKRPGKPRTAEDMFGVDGSFRQLEFD